MYALIVNHRNGEIEYEMYEYRYLKKFDKVKRSQIFKITMSVNRSKFLDRETLF